MKHQPILLAAAMLLAAAPMTLTAQPYYIGGSALNPQWNTTDPANEMVGGPDTYSLTVATVANGYHEFKVSTYSWANSWPGSNAKIKGDAYGSNTFYFHPGTAADGWNPGGNRVGYEDPGNMSWEIMGAFNGWNDGVDTEARQMSAQGGGLYAVDYAIAVPGTYEFKFRSSNSWDHAVGSDFGNSGGNAAVTTLVSNEVVTFQLDLPNGRWRAGLPVTNLVTFTVNMEAPMAASGNDQFAPDFGDKVYVHGDFNGWTTTITPDLEPYELIRVGTSSVFTNTFAMVAKAGSPIYYRFYADPYPLSHEETPLLECGGARVFQQPTGPSILPVSYWSDTQLTDPPNNIALEVDMAVPLATGSFDPGTQSVYARGTFNNWGNSGGGLMLTNLPAPNTNLYVGIVNYPHWPSNGCVNLEYKFLIDDTQWETVNNRSANVTTYNPLLVSAYNNLEICDVLEQTNFVTFTVNMTNAVGTTGTPIYSNQTVYINGDLINWNLDLGPGDWGTSPDTNYALAKVGDSEIHSITLALPPGQQLRVEYKYSIGGEDNEAPGGSQYNHVRYIRTVPGQNYYVMPLDNWGGTNTDYAARQEPAIGYVAVTPGAAGEVNLQWMGLKCAGLQSAGSVSGPWTSYPASAGTSSTNWTTSGDAQYFRVAKPISP